MESPTRWLSYRLAEAAVGPGSLVMLGGRLSLTRPLSSWAAGAGPGVLAAVNGDFFDIDGSGVPLGPVVRDGRLLKGSAEPVKAVGTDDRGRLRKGRVKLVGTVSVAGVTRPLGCLNCLDPEDGFAVYTPAWGTKARPAHRAGPLRSIRVSAGRVTGVRAGADGRPVPADGFLLVAVGSAAREAAGVGPGAAASFTAGQKPRKRPWALAMGYRGTLLRNGKIPVFRTTPRYWFREPRTALGWDDSGRRLWLLVVDGRSLRSAGLTIAATARLLQSHGVSNAVMLDGGGSAEMLARTSPRQGLRIVNNPSEGAERPVPNGLAVLTSRASPHSRER
ncbi:phosphodiester glycosidase family protein [Streptomyces sp. NPDC059193]|uniref:phosphodiester glycosidase family protein n=1 Tax=Streptomyces sp. NPDC059193 TaxID=3346763 RepID=UPI00367B2CA5